MDNTNLDHLIGGCFVLAAMAVLAGWRWSHKGLSERLGTATFTFESWATNTSIGGGVLTLILGLNSDTTPSPEVKLASVVFGIVAGVAPILYNLTTSVVGGELRGWVGTFVVSAILTAASTLGQIVLAWHVVHGATTVQKLPVVDLILKLICVLAAIALVWHAITSVRDTILAQTTAAPGPKTLAAKHRGASQLAFPAL